MKIKDQLGLSLLNYQIATKTTNFKAPEKNKISHVKLNQLTIENHTRLPSTNSKGQDILESSIPRPKSK